jgi:hypothetical protein
MTVEFLPYQPEHMKQLVLQEAQRYMGTWIDDNYANAVANTPAWTCIADGKVICCGGFIEMWTGRAMTWALLSFHASKYFLQLHRYVKMRIDTAGYRRIEATVDREFPDGHRWVHMLGFKLEAERLRNYRPDGADCSLYAKVKP